MAKKEKFGQKYNITFSSNLQETGIGADMTKEQNKFRTTQNDFSPNVSSSSIIYDMADTRPPSILDPPYNLAERQLRHSNQSAGSYQGVPRTYAELITLAIQSSPNKRLVLSEIYNWMYENVPEFIGTSTVYFRVPQHISSNNFNNDFSQDLLYGPFIRVGFIRDISKCIRV